MHAHELMRHIRLYFISLSNVLVNGAIMTIMTIMYEDRDCVRPDNRRRRTFSCVAMRGGNVQFYIQSYTCNILSGVWSEVRMSVALLVKLDIRRLCTSSQTRSPE